MSYYVAMDFIQELKISANKIIELSGRLPVRSWNQEKSAPLGGFTDRAGFVYYDDIEIRNLKDDIELIKYKATGTSDFQIQLIGGGNHNYENREDEFATAVIDWVSKL